jgi:hypothetical protein
MKNKRLLTTLLTFLPWLSACVGNSQIPEPPVEFPFAVEKAGSKIGTELQITEKRIYSFDLYFMYKEHDQIDQARVMKLTGSDITDKTGKLIDPGIPIFLNLKIYRLDAQGDSLVIAKESLEQQPGELGADHIAKIILEIPLDIGRYRINIENLKDVPELAETKIYFHITFAYRGQIKEQTMLTVTIKIANRGTLLSDGKTSSVGHMWYSLDNGNGTITSRGFAPDADHQGQPFAPGAKQPHDNDHYLSTAYSRTIEVTPAQYQRCW